MVGKSTFGNAATGSNSYATMPKTKTPSISSDVAIGRRMNGADMLIAGRSRRPTPRRSFGGAGFRRSPAFRERRREPGLPVRPAEPTRQPLEVEVDDRRRVQG